MGFDATLFILQQEFILPLERSYQPEARFNIQHFFPPSELQNFSLIYHLHCEFNGKQLMVATVN